MAPAKRKGDAAAVQERPEKRHKASDANISKVSVLREEEPAFPRGGASVLTPLEHKQIQIKAKEDVLFEQRTGKKLSKDFESKGEENERPESGPTDSAPKAIWRKRDLKKIRKDTKTVEDTGLRIEGLSFKRLMPGSLVLGQVLQINKYDVKLALPNNLTGYIPITLVSDKLTKDVETLAAEESEDEDVRELSKDIDLNDYFSISQYLRAYVTSTEDSSKLGGKGKKHIELSVQPRQANLGLTKSDLVVNSMVQASVLSVEDHGLVMSLGLEDTSKKAFMSSKELGPTRDMTSIREGSVFLCLITGLSSNGHIIKLSADPQRIGNVKKSNFLTDAPTVDSFLPGTAIEILVSDVTSSGLAGKAMGLLDVTADFIHSGAAASGKSLDKKYPIGSKVKGRIICTFPGSSKKKLGVSLVEHILCFSPQKCGALEDSTVPTSVLPISTIIEQARVAQVEPGVGLFLDIGIKGVRGFVHISRVADDKVETLSESSGAYKSGTVHRARIVGYNPLDGLFLVSMEKRVLDLPFLRLEDVKIGKIVKGSIEKLIINEKGVSGILVKISEGITGLVPEIHMADVHLQHPEKKFREGSSITARVLSVNLEKRQLRLTMKKSLVNSDSAVWKSYDELEVGMQAPGTLVNILPAGAVVQFYGSIRGFLPISQMSESYIQDPKQHFRLGQVINVHVLSLDPFEEKMIVSCRDKSEFGTSQQKALEMLLPGTVAKGAVSEKTNDEIIIELEGSSLKAILPIEHLADGSAHKCLSVAKKIRVGQTLQDLIILSKNGFKRQVRITCKPSLIKAAKSSTLITDFGDLAVGADIAGFVKNITPTGVFVQFAGDLTGLLLKNHIPDDAIKFPDFGFRRNQSISAKVLTIDHGQMRFLLTQKDMPSKEANGKGTSLLPLPDRILSNAVDGTTTSIDDLTFGKMTKATVVSVKDTQLNVQLADGLQGRIDVSEVFDAWEDIKDRKQPLRKFSAKQVLSVRVMGIHDSRNHRFLPITHNNRAPVFELSAKPSDQTTAEMDILTLNKVQPGSAWLVFVNNVADDCLWVNLSPNIRGRIRAMDVCDDVSLLADLPKNFPVGSALRARVLSIDVENNKLDLSARSGTGSSTIALDDLSKGMVLPGRVTKVTDRHVMVQLSEQLSAPVHLVDMADDYSTVNLATYEKNQTIRVCVSDIDKPNKKILLSTRPSKVLSSSSPVVDPEIASISQLKINDIVRGFIKNVADNGLFVGLANSVTAFIRISDLSDAFIKDWKSNYQVDQLVRGKIIALDLALHHIQMSLKESVLKADYKALLTYTDLNVGQIVTGRVRKVEDFGVFIVLDNSANVSGLCHRSEMAEERVTDVKKLYSEGDIVKAKVLKLDLEKRRISLGLKASYFAAEQTGSHSNEDDDFEDLEEMNGVQLPIGNDDESQKDEMEGVDVDLDNVAEIDDREDDADSTCDDKISTESVNTHTKDRSSVQELSTGGFDWTGGLNTLEVKDVQSDIDLETTQLKKNKKRGKAEIKVDRTGDLDTNGPQSIADFERLLMGQPNSSYLWLCYMAFHLQLSEVGKAREIAERAIRTVNHQSRESDSEALNIWVAFLNLENTYGNDGSVEEVFKRACEYNDAEEIHNRLTSIYIQSGKNNKADELLQSMVKKFSQDPKIWLNYATFLFDTLGAPQRARELLPRALQSLPKFNHLDVTSKFAQLEFRSSNGDPERGRTIFEGILSTFPKRLDIWNVLLDLEVKLGDKEQVRRLFGRVTSSRLKARKAKFFFKRWFEYEEKEGDAKSCEQVKARAAEYVREQELLNV